MPGFLRKSPWSMSHPRQSFYFILSLPLLLSKGPHHARESVGRRKSSQLSVALTAPPANPSPREQVCSRPTVGFVEDIGNALKGGVNVCQRQLANEVLGPLVTESVRNFGREDATPYQRGSNASLLGRVQTVKLIKHNALRHLRAAPEPRWSPVERTRFKVVPGTSIRALLSEVASFAIPWDQGCKPPAPPRLGKAGRGLPRRTRGERGAS